MFEPCLLLFFSLVIWLGTRTAGIVAGCKQNTTGGFPDANEVAGGRGAHDTVLADEQLLDAVSGTNFSNQLSDLWVVVAAITANDEERAIDALGDGQQDRSNKRLAVVGLLEDLDLLAEAGAARDIRVSTVLGQLASTASATTRTELLGAELQRCRGLTGKGEMVGAEAHSQLGEHSRSGLLVGEGGKLNGLDVSHGYRRRRRN